MGESYTTMSAKKVEALAVAKKNAIVDFQKERLSKYLDENRYVRKYFFGPKNALTDEQIKDKMDISDKFEIMNPYSYQFEVCQRIISLCQSATNDTVYITATDLDYVK